MCQLCRDTGHRPRYRNRTLPHHVSPGTLCRAVGLPGDWSGVLSPDTVSSGRVSLVPFLTDIHWGI